MKGLNSVFALLLLSSPAVVHAHDDVPKGTPVNAVGLMSDEVIQARLKMLGYEPIRIMKTHALRYEVSVMKNGKFFLIDFHPQLGSVKVSNPNITSALDMMPKEFVNDKSGEK